VIGVLLSIFGLLAVYKLLVREYRTVRFVLSSLPLAVVDNVVFYSKWDVPTIVSTQIGVVSSIHIGHIVNNC
jgi:multidrug efflux pump subunit AcrB